MADKKGFNLAEALASVPKLDTADAGQKKIEYIDTAYLFDDPKNFYTLSDLDSLVENIELVGLQQPLLVRADPENPGYYVIVSGHRRRAAIRKLVDEGREDLRKIPCIVEAGQESAAMQELRLIFANSSTRKLTDAELADQADRVTALLYQLKEEGVEFPGRMRDHVAEACQVSKSKLARLKVIKEKLEPPFIQRWQAGELDESPAYELARMPMEIQWRIGKFKKLPSTSALSAIREKAEKGPTWTPTFTCPGGTPCAHADSFLHAFVEFYGRDCDGSKCCLNCSRGAESDGYNICKRMCATARAAYNEKRDNDSAKAKTAEKRRITAAQHATIPNAKRVLRAVDAAGLADNVSIPWLYSNQISVGQLRQWASGNFSSGWSPYMGAQFSPKELREPLNAAKTLCCSADYLLGLTDDLHPGASPTGYITEGNPPEPTEAMVLLNYDMDVPFRLDAKWDGHGWWAAGTALTEKVLAWYPLPPTPKMSELSKGSKNEDPDTEGDNDET